VPVVHAFVTPGAGKSPKSADGFYEIEQLTVSPRRRQRHARRLSLV